MRRVSFGFLFLFVVPAAAQDKPPTTDKAAEAVVRKAIDAHGGKDALAKHTTVKFTIKGTLRVGSTDNPFGAAVTTGGAGKYRLEMEATLEKQKYSVTQVVNGSAVKSGRTLNGLPLAALSDAEREELVTAAAVQEAGQLMPLLDPKRFTLKTAPDELVAGKSAAGVMATLVESKKDLKLLFDRETGLLVKTSRKGLGPGENGPVDVVQDAEMSGFKVFEGVKVATVVKVTHDGKPFMTLEVAAYARVDKPDPKLFDPDN
jgi:hypothetical protein